MSKKENKGRKLYNPFVGKDGPEHRFKLKPTSKLNVAAVCEVMAERMSLTYRSRASYADQAGITPSEYEEIEIPDESGKIVDKRKQPVFDLEDVWSEYYIHAALAQEMFYNFPTIVQSEYDDESDTYKIDVIDEELFNSLSETEVNNAFLDFSRERNGILNALLQSYNA